MSFLPPREEKNYRGLTKDQKAVLQALKEYPYDLPVELVGLHAFGDLGLYQKTYRILRQLEKRGLAKKARSSYVGVGGWRAA